MSDGNKLQLEIIRSPQPADGSSLIWARAKATVVDGGQSTIPSSPQSVTFQIEDGKAGQSNAVFYPTNDKKTSADTNATSGWTDFVKFDSKQSGDGVMHANWTSDASAFDEKPFAFTPAPTLTPTPPYTLTITAWPKVLFSREIRGVYGTLTDDLSNPVRNATCQIECSGPITPNKDSTTTNYLGDFSFTVQAQSLNGITSGSGHVTVKYREGNWPSDTKTINVRDPGEQ